MTYKSIIGYRVIFADTDAGGIVYHSRYLEIAERGRNQLMRDLGLDIGTLLNEKNVGFALRSVDMKFHTPALFDNKLTIATKLERLMSASSVWLSLVRRRGTQICTVRASIVCIDRINKNPVVYPGSVLKAFKKLAVMK